MVRLAKSVILGPAANAYVERLIGSLRRGLVSMAPNLLPILLTLGLMGWTGIPVSSSYAACATGSQALESARTRILAGMCDVAVVVGEGAAGNAYAHAFNTLDVPYTSIDGDVALAAGLHAIARAAGLIRGLVRE